MQRCLLKAGSSEGTSLTASMIKCREDFFFFFFFLAQNWPEVFPLRGSLKNGGEVMEKLTSDDQLSVQCK